MYIILTLTPIPIKIKRETMVIVGKVDIICKGDNIRTIKDELNIVFMRKS
jgi:hypothetical protein